MREDDEMRWLLALISDTGMRLAEAAGLHKDDITLDAPAPYINLQPHFWRRLKTKSSARHIPLMEPLSGLPEGCKPMIVAMPSHAIVMARYVMLTQQVLHSTNG